MIQANDHLLSKLAVKLQNPTSLNTKGSGILYSNENLKDKIYILTAAHTLYKDGDKFQEPLENITVAIYNPKTNSYDTINLLIDYNLINTQLNGDIAVLLVDRNVIEVITGPLPNIESLKERQSATSFVLKGFPKATNGEEIACIKPIWNQSLLESKKFQLQLLEDYTESYIDGFSGSGIFLHTNNHLYLYGIFTRYREEEKGKIIYCEYIEAVNELLKKNYLTLISTTFLGEHGLTMPFFENNVMTAVENLGERFDPRLNFKLPIARQFNDIAKDEIFKSRLSKIIDKWITERSSYFNTQGKDTITDIENELITIQNEVKDWLSKVDWLPGIRIDIKPIIERLEKFENKIRAKESDVYKLQTEQKRKDKAEGKNIDYSYQSPYDQELYRLRKIVSNNDDLIDNFDKINIALSNYPCLIIKGDAGCGKSHLLGDIASDLIKKHKPVLLLLGQHFRAGKLVWENIIRILELSCTKEELLTSLDNIGKQQGSRVLILIDALNEGAGKELWFEELAGFLRDISSYPFVGLVLTIRSTYYDDIVPPYIRKKEEITQLTHEGFRGNEYEALRLFCEHHNLPQPKFPLLAPEFTNPLFLKLTCIGVKQSPEKVFPQGFQGMRVLFGYYIEAMNDKFKKKKDRLEYRLQTKLVNKAIGEVAKACFEKKGTRSLSLDEASALFDKKFSKFPYLLDDLILESVLIRNKLQKPTTDELDEFEEVVYFSYERFGDFFIADELLKKYQDDETLKEAFREGKELGLLVESSWRNKGILTALSILVPEKYGLELFEVFDWIYKKDYGNYFYIDTSLNHYLMDSLKWRTIKSIDGKKLAEWINSENFDVDRDSFLYHIIELTTVKEHPFNSDRLNYYLKQFTMPDRDAFWQQYLRGFIGKNDYGNAYPLNRLIDWAWQPNISKSLDTETARLTGQTLAWLLTSTNRTLRDQTTKAMVNLFEEQTDALIAVLENFREVDDLYIIERLYAVAYGCALRTTKEENLQKIAQCVFDNIFSKKKPPNHILLRDYARNTVEYAIYKKIRLTGKLSLIKPPYGSKMPLHFPSPTEVKVYEMDHKLSGYHENYGSQNNRIYYSVLKDNFGDYKIDSALSEFSAKSFTAEKRCRAFYKIISSTQRDIIKAVVSIYSKKTTIQEKIKRTHGDEKVLLEDSILGQEKIFSEALDALRVSLGIKRYNFFEKIFLPFIYGTQRMKGRSRYAFDTDPIKRWIVKRVFDLGYNIKLHGSYDYAVTNYDRSKQKVERIGKKYQWIAFHEIFSMITDNYKISKNWVTDKEYMVYPGAWKDYLRDVDPAFITKNNEDDTEDFDSEVQKEINSSEWFVDTSYNHWDEPDAQWVNNIQNLPDPKYVIQVKDSAKIDWLYLNIRVEWQKPKPVGAETYNSEHKYFWYEVQGYFTKKSEKKKIANWLKNKDLFRISMPQSNRANSALFNRENYWSRASKANRREEVWQDLYGSNYSILVTTSEATGEFSDDYSGAHSKYDMPCKLLFEGLNLKYASIDGDFTNNKDESIITGINPTGVLIRKEVLLNFLHKNNLEIIWTLTGVKRASYIHPKYGKASYSKNIFGVYYLEEGRLEGAVTYKKDN